MAVAPAHDRCACDALVCLQFRVSENEDFVRNVLVRRLIVREYLRRRSESTSLSHLRRGDCLVYGAFDILRGTLRRDDVVDVEHRLEPIGNETDPDAIILAEAEATGQRISLIANSSKAV